jgi:hypothetical protein
MIKKAKFNLQIKNIQLNIITNFLVYLHKYANRPTYPPQKKI